MRPILAVAALAIAGCSREPAVTSTPAPPEDPSVRITQFYAEPAIARGEKTSVCYGVANAKTVKIDPPVESLWPTVARCFPVSPVKDTTYTLTAQDAAGKSVSQSIEVRVGPPKPKIIEVSVNKMSVKRGEEVVVCFKASDATAVEIGPGRTVARRGNEFGCVSQRPDKTTTYRVKATGAGGQTDSEQVTVTVAR